MKKVSIIVPVYNVEKYIRKCILSLVAQTYENIEIIFVNDGSPDDSQKIIDEFAERDYRIHSIIKKNEGVSTARNCGLEKATGEYIIFVDSDDYLEPEYTSYFVNMIEKDNSDVAVSFGLYDEKNSMKDEGDDYSLIDAERMTELLYLGRTGVAVWNKIYRKSFLDSHKIRFKKDLWFAEGMTFNVECFAKCEKIATGKKRVYHQTYNPESAVRKFNLKSWYCGMRAMEYQKTIINEKNKHLLNAWEYHFREYNFSILRGIYLSKEQEEYKVEIKRCKRELRKDFLSPLKARISKKDKLKCMLVSAFPIFMAKRDAKKERALRRKIV